MKRRLLIVSPHFPPVNAPDEHRVRMSLPHFVRAGWEVTVLAADDSTPLAPLDPDLLATVPDGVRVVRVAAWSRRWTGRLGINNLGWRVLLPLHRAACRHLRAERFDVVFFSTTQTIVLPLGRVWRARFGVPYVIDLQDPWITDYYERPGAPPPPGGWKYRIARALARGLEGWTLRCTAHLISVSPDYLQALARRYRWFDSARATVLAFGGSEEDLAIARRMAETAPRVLPPSRSCKVVYVGALGPGFHGALACLFAAARQVGPAARPLEFHFLGTSYAAAGAGQPSTAELARQHNLENSVQERTERLGYLTALRVLLEADAVLLFGSDAAGYAPSKIHPVLLTGRPTLAIGPAGSVLEQRLIDLGGAAFFASDDATLPETAPKLAAALRDLANNGDLPRRAFDRDRWQNEHSAAAVAARLVGIFSNVIV